jgi:ribosomal subunit interface protein
MDIVVKSRHVEIKERFRQHVTEKLSRMEKLDSRVIRIDVEVSHEHNPRQSGVADRVELTVYSKGPVIRAEAAAADKYAALDTAVDRLEARLRKVSDRRRVHRGSRTPVSVARATAPLAANGSGSESDAVTPAATPDQIAVGFLEKHAEQTVARDAGPLHVDGEGPLVVREKTHAASPMTLDQALYEMELVGHDFYLFVDAESKQPSVVYRRHGYDYGVIHLAL